MFSGFLLTSINEKYDYRVFTKIFTFYVYIWCIGDVMKEITSILVGKPVCITMYRFSTTIYYNTSIYIAHTTNLCIKKNKNKTKQKQKDRQKVERRCFH